MSNQKIVKGTLVIAAAVLLSRVLGVFRDILLAELVGSGVEKSAYDLAFLIPDLVNHLISTGYLSITFIPIFSGFMVRKDENGAWSFASNVLVIFSAILIPVLALCWIFIRPLLGLLTVSDPDTQTLDLAVRYARIILPAQLCFFYAAIFTAVQHVRMQFVFPALMGLIYNGAIILGGWWGRASGLEGFAWGVLAGALGGGLLLQFWGGRRAGLEFLWSGPRWDADFKRYLLLTLPLVLGLGAVFALEFVFRSFGARWGSSGIASLGYAYRVMYTLVAVFGFAVGVASYPVLSRLAKEKKRDETNALLFSTLSQVASLLLPAMVMVWYFAGPITRVLFQRGSFTAEAAAEVAGLLKIYIWGSFALSAQIVLLRCYYAKETMWRPTLINTGIFLVCLPVYSLAPEAWGIRSIPLIGTLGAMAQVLALFIYWWYSTGRPRLGPFFKELLKIGAVTAASFLLLKLAPSNWRLETVSHGSFWKTAFILGIFGSLGYLIQITLQLGIGVEGAAKAVGKLYRKK